MTAAYEAALAACGKLSTGELEKLKLYDLRRLQQKAAGRELEHREAARSSNGTPRKEN